MKNLASCLLILILSVLLSGKVFADKNCIEDVICIETVRNDSIVDFYVKNLKAFDVTITLIIDTVNLKSPEPQPYTDTIRGYGKVKIFSLPIINNKIKWNYKYNVDWTTGSIYAKHDNSYSYRLPYKIGSSQKISQGLRDNTGQNDNSQYTVDIEMPVNTAVYTARDGIVVGVRDYNEIEGSAKDIEDTLIRVLIKHPDGTIGDYKYLRRDGAKAKAGDRVDRGQFIGYSGGPHLRFSVYKSYNGKRIITFPVKFQSSNGIISCPVKGQSFIAQ